jgi:hypothetical protein
VHGSRGHKMEVIVGGNRSRLTLFLMYLNKKTPLSSLTGGRCSVKKKKKTGVDTGKL